MQDVQDSVLALAGDKDRLASCSADGSCRLWDLRCMRSVRAAVLKQEASSVLMTEIVIAMGGGAVTSYKQQSFTNILLKYKCRLYALRRSFYSRVLWATPFLV